MERLGLIGKPSDWLIASSFDRIALRERLGMEVVDIPIEEITSLGEVDAGMEGAQCICNRLRKVVEREHLDGVTLRCFDLLTTVKNTGCMALAQLNDEGIPAACEGDVPALVTMMLVRRLTGEVGFQCNPAQIEGNEMLFAHCTLPLSMCERYSLTTHFESGMGVAIHGELPLGDYTLVKVSGDLQRVFAEDTQLIRNQYAPNLCRTQVWLRVREEARQYFLTNPIANHHILVRGHYADKFREILP